MDERERMLAGAPYRADRDGLPAEREACARLVFEYNHLSPDRWGDRDVLIRSILGKVGEGVEVNPPFHCDYGTNIEVGDGFYANCNLCVLDVAKVTFGDNCFIGPNVTIATAGHPVLPALREQGLQYNMPVHIGRNCWIGAGAVILPGVTIGDNTVIGAGSVVTKDIPANVVAVGNPCRVLRPIGERDRETYFRGRRIPPELLEEC